MSGAQGQAAGMAVGAAVGAVVGGPAGAVTGASIGGGVGGALGGRSASRAQVKAQKSALKLNQAQAHARAADQSAIHAANFRQALASQVSLANIRGGAGSLTAQFGAQAFESFGRDQAAIAVGATLADAQAALGLASLSAESEAGEIRATGAVISSFDALNLNTGETKAKAPGQTKTGTRVK